jgi:adenosine deaminase
LLLHEGVRVTVNSDDPAYFAGYLQENFTALAEKAELSATEVARLARNAFEIAWITPEARAGFLAELDEYCAEHDVNV